MTLPSGALPSSTSSQNGQGWLTHFQRAGVSLMVAVAVADMLRWRAYPASWTSFDAVMPMAPGLAGLFLIMGAALGLHLFFPANPWARRVALAFSALTVAAALHVLFCELGDSVPRWEMTLGPTELTSDGFSIGRVSAQAAVLLLLSNIALIALFSTLAWLHRVGIFAALLVGFFALVAVLCYAAGNPAVTNDGWLKVPPLVMFEFTLLNVVLLVSGRAPERLRQWFFGSVGSSVESVPISPEETRVFGVLAGVGLLALTASVIYLRIQTTNYRELSVDALQRIADLKVGQIEHWRRERLADAHSFMRMPGLGGNIFALSDRTQAAQRTRFIAWLQRYAQDYGYANIVVFDAMLKPVLSVPNADEISPPALDTRLKELRPDSDVMELPPYVDGRGHLRWDLLVPLPTNRAAGFEGAILLQTNPTRFIIPILQSWPEEYRTGQSALWHRDGDRLVSMGGYRRAPGVKAEELRPLGMMREILKLPPQSLPARILRGETDGGEGLDYRGVVVLGVGRLVRDSPWLFASRVDSSEVYAPLRRSAIGIAGIVAGLFATTGFTTSWLWRQRQRNLLHDRLAAELEQKRLAARLGLVMRHAKDIILVTDEKMRLIDLNQQAVNTYGWTREELLGMSIPDLRAAETLSSLPGIVERANSAEGVIFETLHLRKDGTKFPVEISVRGVEVDDRPHLLAIIRDISERKRAEAELRAVEERAREALEKFNLELEGRVRLRTAQLAASNRESQALLDSIPDTVLLCDGTGTPVSSHSRLDRTGAAVPTEGISPNPHDPVVQEIAREMCARARPLNQAMVQDFDRTLNGTSVSIEARVTPAGTDRLLVLLRDISARKRIERDMQANLERERQLSEMKSQFVSVASHEFRTPLAAAVGSVELLERHAARMTEAKRVELLGRVRNSLGRLTDIMNNVLQLSRADSGRVKVKRIDIDLGRFVQDVVNEVAEGDRQQHTFSFQQSGEPSVVATDTNLLNHILSNLVGNAARYSPPGTKISVTLALDQEAFTLTVADEGIGIPEAERERIFEPFVRGSNVGQIGGTGLGLNIVKRYVELMGGRIEVVPAERGAVFRVVVPVAQPEYEAPTAAAEVTGLNVP